MQAPRPIRTGIASATVGGDGSGSAPAKVVFWLMTGLTAVALAALGTELALAGWAPAGEPDDRATEANAARVVGFFDEVWAGGNLRRIGEFVAVDHVYHDPANPAVAAGVGGVAGVVAALRTAFPDLAFTLDDVVGQEGRVAVRFTMRGTHRGDVLGAEGTDRVVTVTGVAVFRLAHRMIVETWVAWDTFGLAQQVGLFLVPAWALGDWEGAPGRSQPEGPY